jgi:hypothetical protein
MWGVSLAVLAEVMGRIEDPAGAAALYERLLPYRGLIVHPSGAAVMGSADRYLGMLAGAMARRAEAAQHFEDAVRIESGMRSAPLVTRTRYWYARLLCSGPDGQDRSRGRHLAEVAVEAAEQLGMAAVASEARALLG